MEWGIKMKTLRFLTLLLLLSVFSTSSYARERLSLKEYKKRGGDFTLTDQFGKPWNLAKQNKIALIFFGYLNCPDICPTTLMEMLKVKKMLGPNQDKVMMVFITLDPERDTSENLKNYLINFDESLIGLTGSVKEITAVAKQYSAFFQKRKLRSALGYSIDHTGAVYLTDKGGALRFIFPSKSPVERYLQMTEMLLKGLGSTSLAPGENWLSKMLK